MDYRASGGIVFLALGRRPIIRQRRGWEAACGVVLSTRNIEFSQLLDLGRRGLMRRRILFVTDRASLE